MLNKYYYLKETLATERRTEERKNLLAEIYETETEILKTAYIKAVKQNYNQNFLNKLANEINSQDRSAELIIQAIEIIRLFKYT